METPCVPRKSMTGSRALEESSWARSSPGTKETLSRPSKTSSCWDWKTDNSLVSTLRTIHYNLSEVFSFKDNGKRHVWNDEIFRRVTHYAFPIICSLAEGRREKDKVNK